MAMADEARLDQQLSAFIAAKVSFGWVFRMISESEPDGPLDSLLTEISATILPRRLIFRSDTGDVLELFVADRRVFGIAALGGSWANDLPAAITGRLMMQLDDNDTAVLRDLLRTFAARCTCLAVRTERDRNQSQSGAMGISVTALDQPGNVAAGPVGSSRPPAVLDQFLVHLGPIAAAYVVTDSGVLIRNYGDADKVAALSAIIGSLPGNEEKPGLAEGPDQMVILSSGSALADAAGNRHALLFANGNGQELLVWIEARHFLAVSEAWMALTRPRAHHP